MAKFKVGDKVKYQGKMWNVGDGLTNGWVRLYSEDGRTAVGAPEEDVVLANTINPVVANALAWKAKNAKDSDGKELKVGDKIKVRVDMNGRWDGGGVVTALKPYRVVEYKDVFGRINTTQETSVRKA